MNDKVSIIIPTFNRAHTLKKTLKSVQNQTHQNWECIVIDDGSEDSTDSLLLEFLEDDRFHYIKRPENLSKGAATCRNIGLDKSTGDYIQFLDSDDLLDKFKLQKQLQIDCSKEDLLICKWGGIVFKHGREEINLYENIPTYRNIENTLDLFRVCANRFCYLPLHCFLIPREIIGPSRWNAELSINDDGEFMTRIILKANKICFTNKTFVLYRKGAGDRLSKSLNTVESYRDLIKSWQMIENNLGSANLFVRSSKKNLYDKVKTAHPGILKDYKSFFNSRRKKFRYVVQYFWSKLLDRFEIRVKKLHENDIV